MHTSSTQPPYRPSSSVVLLMIFMSVAADTDHQPMESSVDCAWLINDMTVIWQCYVYGSHTGPPEHYTSSSRPCIQHCCILPCAPPLLEAGQWSAVSLQCPPRLQARLHIRLALTMFPAHGACQALYICVVAKPFLTQGKLRSTC